ncbi:MAG: hypothetical protein GY774_35510 [Planctomycetes bacterium]|nr:hypothetical protein [Planctomycetota bacterium]
MIKVQSTLNCYEVQGEDAEMINPPQMTVKSHWNRKGLVIIEIQESNVTVDADDLIKAIRNAQNTK